jgi:DnaJ-domain-containing protein 1
MNLALCSPGITLLNIHESQKGTHRSIHRALQQKRWYEEKFNRDMLPERDAAIPGVI